MSKSLTLLRLYNMLLGILKEPSKKRYHAIFLGYSYGLEKGMY